MNRFGLILGALLTCGLTGCLSTAFRQATVGKLVTALAAVNPFRGPMEAGATLFARIGLFVVIDDWLGTSNERRRDDSSDER